MRWADVTTLHRLGQFDAFEQALSCVNGAQATHRLQAVFDRDMRALDRLGGQRPLAVQSCTAVLRLWSVLSYRPQVRPVLVGDNLTRDNAPTFDGLFEKRLGAL
jgi:hypothetical protein